MSCGGLSKSKTLERFLGFGVSCVHRMTPNGVETASGPLLSERESDFFSRASSGEKSNADVAFKESPCGKMV